MKGGLLMKNNSFKLICNNCGNMAELKDDASNQDYDGKFIFYPIQNERISIYCQKCDNDVFIDEK
jgi:Fe2+ or Zn2+ uptake regulation protein